jgi:hypothetical protein
MRVLLRESERHSLGDFVGSISVAVIEIEIFTSPLWLGYAIFLYPVPVRGYLPAWFFICWGLLALYIGVERVVSLGRCGQDWPTPRTLTGALMSLLLYNTVVVVGIFLVRLSWTMTNSFLFTLAFSIIIPIWLLKSLELLIIGFDGLAEMGDKT